MTQTEAAPDRPRPSPLLKAAIDYFPLIVFFAAYWRPDMFRALLPAALYDGDKPGMFVATALVVPSTLLAVAASWLAFRKVPVMLWFTAAVVIALGGMTLYLHDAEFIKLKLTLVYGFFAALLLGGLAFDKVLLPMVLEGAMKLDDIGWRKLTFRWGLCFLALAALNEIVRRTQSDDVWVAFKFPGTAILIFVFLLTQMPLILKHEVKE